MIPDDNALPPGDNNRVKRVAEPFVPTPKTAVVQTVGGYPHDNDLANVMAIVDRTEVRFPLTVRGWEAFVIECATNGWVLLDEVGLHTFHINVRTIYGKHTPDGLHGAGLGGSKLVPPPE